MDATNLQQTMKEARKVLAVAGCSLVVIRPSECRISEYHSRGVLDLYTLYSASPALLCGAVIADKVVGKGAAALMALGGIEALTTPVISRDAIRLLQEAGITVEADIVVPNIINRAGTGICPVESLCAEAKTPAECLPLIKQFLKEKSLI